MTMYDMKAYYEAASVADAVALRLAHPEADIIARAMADIGKFLETYQQQ